MVANSAYLALERRVVCERTRDARAGGHCAPFGGVQGTKRAQARLKRCDIREHVQLDFTCEIALQARRNRAPDGNGGLEGAPCQQIFEIGSWREAGWGSRAPLDANLSSRSPACPASQNLRLSPAPTGQVAHEKLIARKSGALAVESHHNPGVW